MQDTREGEDERGELNQHHNQEHNQEHNNPEDEAHEPPGWSTMLSPRKIMHRMMVGLFYHPYMFLQLNSRITGWRDTFGGKFLYVDLEGKTKQVMTVEMAPPLPNTIRVVCLSDTHEAHDYIDVPGGDLLLHCGDLSFQDRGELGSKGRLETFNSFLGSLPHKRKVFIGGNHDQVLVDLGRKEVQKIMTNAIYLENSEVTLEDLGGLRIYGSPTSPRGGSGNKAFQKSSQKSLKEVWEKIPHGIDILLTHGSEDNLFREIHHKKPAVHVSGHFHMLHGARFAGNTAFINASILDNRYFPTHLPVVFDYPLRS